MFKSIYSMFVNNKLSTVFVLTSFFVVEGAGKQQQKHALY